MSQRRAALVVLLGLVLLANPLYLPVDVGSATVTYSHEATQAVNGTVRGPFEATYDQSDVLAYENLSERGQTVFRRALNGERRIYLVTDESKTAPEFSYPTETFSVGDGIYVVRYEGETYGLVTRRFGGDGDVTMLVQTRVIQPVLAGTGVLLVFFVARRYYGDSDDGDDAE